MDVSTLRMLVKRLFGLGNDAEFELWHLNDGKEVSGGFFRFPMTNPEFQISNLSHSFSLFLQFEKQDVKSKLDQDERDLKFYSINDNATIEIVQ